MSQAFTFGFDSDIDEDDGYNPLEKSHTNLSDGSSLQVESQLEEPRLHSLEEMLSSLPSTISYSASSISAPDGAIDIQIPRRELFDIRAQLMAEDPDVNMHNDAARDSIAGLAATDDITPGVYEGGFKTWECAVDLAGYLAGRWDAMMGEAGSGGLHVVELGAGTALPTLTILHLLLTQPNPLPSPLQLTLADYNPAVLHLATIPNLLLTHTLPPTRSEPTSSVAPSTSAHDLDITPSLLTRFSADLARRNIHISGISGAWSPALANLVINSRLSTNHPFSSSPTPTPTRNPPPPPPRTLILASETIYSPSSLLAFADTLFALLQACGGKARALVAAKNVYFGVGGGVEEFLGAVRARGGTGEVVWESGGGVGRVILEVRRL